MTAQLQRHLFTLEEFARMGEVGILNEDDRVEFLDGELLEMSTIGGRHTGCVIRLDRLAQRAVGEGLLVSVQNPLRIGDQASFLPDLAVLRATEDLNEVPTSEQALLVIEVADSSRSYDRGTKLPRYAAAEIPEAWLVDLADERIERHTEPGDDGYRQVAVARRGEGLSSTVVEGLVLVVDEVLGR